MLGGTVAFADLAYRCGETRNAGRPTCVFKCSLSVKGWFLKCNEPEGPSSVRDMPASGFQGFPPAHVGHFNCSQTPSNASLRKIGCFQISIERFAP